MSHPRRPCQISPPLLNLFPLFQWAVALPFSECLLALSLFSDTRPITLQVIVTADSSSQSFVLVNWLSCSSLYLTSAFHRASAWIRLVALGPSLNEGGVSG